MQCPLAQTFCFLKCLAGFYTLKNLRGFLGKGKKAKLDVSYLLAKVQKEEEKKKMKCFWRFSIVRSEK
jgi:hypothetical protein